METMIKITPSELDNGLIDKIKQFIGTKKNVDVTISIKEFDSEYVEDLNRSIVYAGNGNNLISFSMEDFMAYEPSK